MQATWYLLEDGIAADPNECAPDEAGVLRHKGGAAVATRGNAYSSRSVDLSEDGTIKPETSKPGRYARRDARARD